MSEGHELLERARLEARSGRLDTITAALRGMCETRPPSRPGCGMCRVCALVAIAEGREPELPADVRGRLERGVAAARALTAWLPVDDGWGLPEYVPLPTAPRPALDDEAEIDASALVELWCGR